MGKLGFHAASVGPQIGFKSALGTGASTTLGTTLVITTTAAIAVDDLVVVRVAADNLSATTPTFTCADSGGNTYTAHRFAGQNATAAAGVVGAILATKATAPVASGGTITVTLSGSVTDKAAYAESFLGYKNQLSLPASAGAGASTSPLAGAPVANTGDLVIGAAAVESRTAPTFDADTVYGSWSTGVTVPSAATSTDTSRVEINGQYKRATGAGPQNYNNTTVSTDWVALLAIFRPTVALDFYEAFTTVDAWTVASTTLPAGRNGTALQCAGATAFALYNLPADVQLDTITLGFAFRRTDADTTLRALCHLKSDADATLHNSLVYTPSSTTLAFYRGNSAGTLLASNAAVTFVQNTWYYIELQVKLHDTTGTVQVRINGVDSIALTTALDTKAAGTKTGYDSVRLHALNAAATHQYDDLYLVMGAGAAFKGDIVVA